MNSEGLATCRCGSDNVYLRVAGNEGEVLWHQAECPRCDRRGPHAPRQTAISLWNADMGLYDTDENMSHVKVGLRSYKEGFEDGKASVYRSHTSEDCR
jgi:hypothetical protein